jgi:hypothetical protein
MERYKATTTTVELVKESSLLGKSIDYREVIYYLERKGLIRYVRSRFPGLSLRELFVCVVFYFDVLVKYNFGSGYYFGWYILEYKYKGLYFI